MAFHPTIESACNARSKGGEFGLHPASAKVLVPRGLRPVEITNPNDAKKSDGNNTLRGWTWSTDQALTIQPAQTLSSAYVRAFLNRVTSPVLALLATEKNSTKSETVSERMAWFCKAKVTVKRIEGSHSVHMENAQMVSGHVCNWILDQDAATIARL
ncbi:hypothetical protein KVV02_000174 [Mortierella alpina]|uniref:Uncharacterized protein n=1 Tax=Mortierella alpina TaxID=64518 RepID=A0A9P8CZR5_MORAP|nr:hypothetical protein KVV02_000174 [Mortierella alpina]